METVGMQSTVLKKKQSDDMRKNKKVTFPEKMMRWSREMTPPSRKLVAIEFDRCLIKFIKAQRKKDGFDLQYLKVKFLSSGSDEEIKETLRHHLNEMGIKSTTHAIVSIPGHRVHTKILRLPAENINELQKMIIYQLQKNIPLPPEDIISDFRIVSRDEDGYARVMVVMARKDEIQHYLDLCFNAGLIVDSVRLNIEAIYQAYLNEYDRSLSAHESMIVLVDVDFSSTNVMLIDNGSLLFCRSINKGIEDLMDRMVGARGNQEYNMWISELADGIIETIAIYEREGHYLETDQVLLGGWLPRRDTLIDRLSDMICKPVSLFCPEVANDSLLNSADSTISHNWFSVSSLIGIAGSKDSVLMDLRPEAARQLHRKRSILRQVSWSVLKIAALIMLFTIAFKIAIFTRRSATEALISKIHEIQPALASVTSWEKEKSALARRLGSQEKTTRYISQVFENLPEGIYLSSMTFTRAERILLRGSAPDMATVLSLPKILGNQDLLKTVTINSADRRRQLNGNDLIEFELTVALKQMSRK